jgi:hypothetical protein
MGHDQFARFEKCIIIREPSRPNLKLNSNEYEVRTQKVNRAYQKGSIP